MTNYLMLVGYAKLTDVGWICLINFSLGYSTITPIFSILLCQLKEIQIRCLLKDAT